MVAHELQGSKLQAIKRHSPRFMSANRLASECITNGLLLSLSFQNPSGATFPGASPLYATPITL